MIATKRWRNYGKKIRYRIEYCPCTAVDDDFVQLDVVASAGAERAVRSPAPRHPRRSRRPRFADM